MISQSLYTIVEYSPANYKKLFISPYIENYYDSENNILYFSNILFDTTFYLELPINKWIKLKSMLEEGMEENDLESFLLEQGFENNAHIIIEEMLKYCIIE